MIPTQAQMTAALDAAFAEHIKTLFVNLVANISDSEAPAHFERGLSNACWGYRYVTKVIGELK